MSTTSSMTPAAARAFAEAAQIVRRLLTTSISGRAIAKEYRVSRIVITAIYAAGATREQRMAAKFRKIAARAAATQFKPGERRPASRATQFKAGCLRGFAARVWVPVGTIRIHKGKQGQRRIKMPDGRWQLLARAIWEQLHGPIPRGHCIYYRDGDLAVGNDRLNDRPENLICLPRPVGTAMIARRIHADQKSHERIVAGLRRGRSTQRAVRAALSEARTAKGVTAGDRDAVAADPSTVGGPAVNPRDVARRKIAEFLEQLESGVAA